MNSVAGAMKGHLDEERLQYALSRLYGRIKLYIRRSGKNHIEDIDVLDILRKMGSPEHQASILVQVLEGSKVTTPERSERPAHMEPSEGKATASRTKQQADMDSMSAQVDVRQSESVKGAVYNGKKHHSRILWLGVCVTVAGMLDWPVWALRTLIFLLGLVLTPLAIVVYLLAYFWLRAEQRLPVTTPLRPLSMTVRPLLTGLSIIAIHMIGVYAVKAAHIVYETWFDRLLPPLGDWAWIQSTGSLMLWIAMLYLLPLALLSAMPLADTWEYSLKRFTQACVALYAIIISFGIASYITGIILVFVREFIA